MTIDAAAIPRPARVEVETLTTLQQSRWRDGALLFSREPDPANRRRRWGLIYETAPAAVGDALRRHFAAYHGTDFTWTPPGSNQPVRVIYSEPTSIDWANPASCSARVYLEECLAHD